MIELEASETRLLEAVSRLAFCNPFLPERVEIEKQALGSAFVGREPVWSLQPNDPLGPPENVLRITERVEALVERIAEDRRRRSGLSAEMLQRYEEAVVWLLYHRFEEGFSRLLECQLAGRSLQGELGFFADFQRLHHRLLDLPGSSPPTEVQGAHLFACFFQVRRAFHHIIRNIVGGSMPAAGLRAAVWQSIFTHDMRRYRRALFDRMQDFSTLITGPSGTGKELVAQAIGLSRYIPFDAGRRRFEKEVRDSFFPLNLSALAPTLIESELFGHRRGAFTGALEDRVGWFEVCPRRGSVFLDEIGELEPSLQVKLLRVIESRTFQRLGETEDRRFEGKLIAATHRDLERAIDEGDFREDLYYRLCSDLVRTPSLREQLDASPDDLRELVLFLAQRAVPEDAEVLAAEVEAWIGEHLGADYPWPGNIRELDQCLRNVLVRKDYRPARGEGEGLRPLLARAADLGLGADELLRLYCTWTVEEAGSYLEAGRRLGLDRRTVKGKLDRELLSRLSGPRTSRSGPKGRG